MARDEGAPMKKIITSARVKRFLVGFVAIAFLPLTILGFLIYGLGSILADELGIVDAHE